MDIRKAIKAITGSEPSNDQVQRIMAIAHQLDMPNGDPMLAMLAVFDVYYGIIVNMPEAAQKAAESAAGLAAEKSKARIDELAATTRNALAKAVAASAAEVSSAVAKKRMFQWAGGSIAIAFVACGLFGWRMYDLGAAANYKAGYNAAIEKSRIEKAAASWANTPIGHKAYELAQVGSINRLATCDEPGWEIRHGVCLPFAAKNGKTYGWFMPMK